MANRQIGWSQEANLLYLISGQVDRVAQIIASSGVGGGVSSFNTRTGDITLLSSDVTTALGYTPTNGNIYGTNGSLTGVRTVNTGAYALAFTATQPAASYAFTIGTPTGVSVPSWPATFVRQGEFNISSTSSAEPENSRYWGRNQTTALKSLYVNQSYADVTAETAGGGVSLYNQSIRTYRGSPLDISTAVTTLSNLTGVVNTIGHGYSGTSLTTAQIHTQNVNAVQSSIQNNVGTMVNANGYRIILSMSPTSTSQNSAITNFYGVNIGTFTIGATSGPTATITNFYALYIDGITTRATGTVTNRWGIYSTDSTMTHYLNGNVLIGTSTIAGFKLDVNGTMRASQFYLSALNSTPASAGATGTLGEIRIDANYIYVCTATNTWKRASIATW